MTYSLTIEKVGLVTVSSLPIALTMALMSVVLPAPISPLKSTTLVSKFLISQEEQEFNLHLNNGVYIIKIIGDLNVFSTSTHLILN